MATVLVSGLGASRARAQEQGPLGHRHANALTVESLAGFMWDRSKVEGSDPSTAWTAGLPIPQSENRGSLPARLGYHRFISGVSLGVIGSYLESGGGTTSYLVGFRAGYSLPMGNNLSLWTRAGVNYSHQRSQAGLGYTLKTWSVPLCGDLLFAYAPASHVVLTAGASAELGVAGEVRGEGGEGGGSGSAYDLLLTRVAGTLGVVIDF